MRFAASTAILLAPCAHAVPACTVSIGAVAFGAYSPLSGASRDSSGSVGVSCSDSVPGNVAYGIALSAGTGSFSARSMTSAGHALGYNLFTDPGRNVIWGDGTAGTSIASDSYAVTVSPTLRTYPVYGRIAAGQTQAHVGTYGDNILVTVTF